MAPSQPTSSEATAYTSGDIDFILKVLRLSPLKIDVKWKVVAPVVGINRWDNALARWKKIALAHDWASFREVTSSTPDTKVGGGKAPISKKPPVKKSNDAENSLYMPTSKQEYNHDELGDRGTSEKRSMTRAMTPPPSAKKRKGWKTVNQESLDEHLEDELTDDEAIFFEDAAEEMYEKGHDRAFKGFYGEEV